MKTRSIFSIGLVRVVGLLPGLLPWLVLCGGSLNVFSEGGPTRWPQTASASTRVGLGGGGRSFKPVFSADGRFVVFVSQAKNLVTNDSQNMKQGVYRCDMSSGNIGLVSVSSNGIGGADSDAWDACVSADGRWVAFASGAGNLAGENSSSPSDVFLRDMALGKTVRASVDGEGNAVQAPYPGSERPFLTADGAVVFFDVGTTNRTNGYYPTPAIDVFARDMAAATTRMLSGTTNGSAVPYYWESYSRGAGLCSITPDGSRAAFVADNVLGMETSLLGFHVYVNDMKTGSNVWASSDAAALYSRSLMEDGWPAPGTRHFNAAVSANGRYVAFKTTALPSPSLSNLLSAPVWLFRHDLEMGETVLIATTANDQTWPRISADGRYVAWDDRTNVLRWDASTGSNVLVSVNRDGTGPGEGVSKTPVMSPDGRYVVFISAAADLTSLAGNGSFQVYWRDMESQTTKLVTVNRHGQASAADHEFIEPDLTADGEKVAFESTDDDLVPGDSNHAGDVFVRDMAADVTMLISRRHPTLPCLTGWGHAAMASGACLSADGRFLVFSSQDSNLAPSDTNGWQDVFVRDLSTGSNQMVGVWTNPMVNPIMSANGRYLLVTKAASLSENMQAGEVYRFDRWSNALELVNRRFDGEGPSASPAYARAISADGRLVLFLSQASDLLPGYYGGITRAFLRDIQAGINQVVSLRIHDGHTHDSCVEAWLSPDPTKVAFVALGTQNYELFLRDLTSDSTVQVSLDGTASIGCNSLQRPSPFTADPTRLVFQSYSGLVLHDLTQQTNLWIDRFGGDASMSHDHRWIAYRARPMNDAGGYTRTNHVFVFDSLNGTSNLVTVAASGVDPANGGPGAPLITPDGRYVIFGSAASNLVDDDANGAVDLFLRDMHAGTTIALSRSIAKPGTANGHSGNSTYNLGSVTPPNYQLSADGHTLVFESFASDLVPGDYNDKCDIFVLRIGSADSDGDGMDDDWEMAYFGKLDRDGLGDFDADGANDLAEFAAGTDPTNRGSVLRVFTLTSLSSNGTTLLWPAAPGKTYKAQYKDQLQATEWKDLPGPVTVNGSTATAVDLTTSGATQRFYRVLVE